MNQKITAMGKAPHPVEHLACPHVQAKSQDIRGMADRYDILVSDDPILKQQLDELLGWACAQREADIIHAANVV